MTLVKNYTKQMAPHSLNNKNCAEKNQFVQHYLFLPSLLFLFLCLRRSVGIWESCFQCFWVYLWTPKCKKTVKKFLDELIYFQVLYMQITEEQVGFVFHFYFQPIISSLFCTHIINNRWLLDTCHIDQTITSFVVICLLQGKCGHPIQINLLKMRMMTPFRFLFALQLKMFSW